MAWLIERAPAGEIFSAQAMADVALTEITAQMLFIQRDRSLGRQRLTVHELRPDDVGISPDGWAPDVDRVLRHLPAFRAGTSDAFRCYLTEPFGGSVRDHRVCDGLSANLRLADRGPI